MDPIERRNWVRAEISRQTARLPIVDANGYPIGQNRILYTTTTPVDPSDDDTDGPAAA